MANKPLPKKLPAPPPNKRNYDGTRGREVAGILALGASLFVLFAMLSSQAHALVMGPFGRSAAALFVDDATLALWEARVTSRAHVSHVLLFQLAMPSEILGYVLGLVRYSFGTYMAVLAVSEIPYALAVVYLGESFLAGNAATFVLIGTAVVATTAALYYVVRRRLT